MAWATFSGLCLNCHLLPPTRLCGTEAEESVHDPQATHLRFDVLACRKHALTTLGKPAAAQPPSGAGALPKPPAPAQQAAQSGAGPSSDERQPAGSAQPASAALTVAPAAGSVAADEALAAQLAMEGMSGSDEEANLMGTESPSQPARSTPAGTSTHTAAAGATGNEDALIIVDEQVVKEEDDEDGGDEMLVLPQVTASSDISLQHQFAYRPVNSHASFTAEKAGLSCCTAYVKMA